MSTRVAEFEAVIGLRDNLSKATKGLVSHMEGDVGRAMKTVGVGMGVMGGAITGAFGLGVKGAIEFESAFTGVEKTFSQVAGSTKPVNVELAELRKRFEDMSTEIPITFSELSRIGEVSGQLGVQGADNIAKFTEVIAKIGVTTDLAAEDAAVAFAQIANVMQEPISNADRMGSTVVALGNNFATNEAKITGFAQRIAGVGQIVGLTTPEIFSIGTAFSSVGVEAEAGGTSVQTTLNTINAAVITGGDELKVFADTAGLSTTEFARLFKEDAAEAFTLFVEGLGRQGSEAVLTLGEVGLQGERTVTSLLSAAGAGDLLRNAIESGNGAWQENTALTKEAETRFKTVESQLQIFKNTIALFAATIGEHLLPALTGVLEKAQPMIEWATDFIEKHPHISAGVIGVTAAFGGLMTVLAPMLFVLPNIVTGFGLVSSVLGVGGVATAATTATTAVTGLGTAATAAGVATKVGLVASLIGPLGVVAAAGATAFGIYKLGEHLDLWGKKTRQQEQFNKGLNEGLDGMRDRHLEHQAILDRLVPKIREEGEAKRANTNASAANAFAIGDETQAMEMSGAAMVDLVNGNWAAHQATQAAAAAHREKTRELAASNVEEMRLRVAMEQGTEVYMTRESAADVLTGRVNELEAAEQKLIDKLVDGREAAELSEEETRQLKEIHDAFAPSLNHVTVQLDSVRAGYGRQAAAINQLGPQVGQMTGQYRQLAQAAREASAALGVQTQIPNPVQDFLDTPPADIPPIDQNFEGTSFAPGGLSTLGERGPELVLSPTLAHLNRGAAVLNASDTAAAMGGGGGGGGGQVTNHFGPFHVRRDGDIDGIVNKIKAIMTDGVQQARTGRGLSPVFSTRI